MTKSDQFAVAAIGVCALLFAVAAGSAEASPPSEPAAGPKPSDAPEADPLPEYELTQPNVIAAIIEFVEQGQKTKLQSVVIKSLSAPLAMRAYVIAALESVPAQLKADAEFVKQFERDESKRIAAIQAVNDRNDAIVRATETLVVTVVTKVNAIAGAVVAIGVALGEAARTIIARVEGIPKRSAAEQIYPLREGYGMRRGVLFQPDLPYVTRGEIELSDKVRKRWLADSEQSQAFAELPELQRGTELRFAPRWNDYAQAVKKLQEKGIEP